MGVTPAKADPPTYKQASIEAVKLLKKEKIPLNQRVVNMIIQVFRGVDAKYMPALKKEVINPWLKAVKLGFKKYISDSDDDGIDVRFENEVFKMFEELLNQQINDFIGDTVNDIGDQGEMKNPNKRKKRGDRADVQTSKYTQSIFSPKDLAEWLKAVKAKDYKKQGEIAAKYRGKS